MNPVAAPDAPRPSTETPEADGILNALATAIITVDADTVIRHVNNAAEQFLQGSQAVLVGLPLTDLMPADSPLFGLIHQARVRRTPVSEYQVSLESPRIGRHFVNIQAAPMADLPGHVVLTFQERTIADTIDRQLNHRGAVRSVTAMAAMMAHEVKNPLSGIRGAAQLLEGGLNPDDQALTTLIKDETDRICLLVDQFEAFSDQKPTRFDAINIHLVLNRVRQLAQAGFGRHVRFVEHYDPSLPPVLGNHDQLLQVFLNLVKNATEAVPEQGGEIILGTAYRHGVRFAVPGSDSRVHLPLMITVQDNGEGIPDDIRPNLFDPFVSSKPRGKGLGMALVAKIINDHGGVIGFDSQPRRTIFRVMLPVAPTDQMDWDSVGGEP